MQTNTNNTSGKSINILLPFFIASFSVLFFINPPAAASDSIWNTYQDKPAQWFTSPQAKTILANIISWQDLHGAWPKSKDTASAPYTGDKNKLKGTFDNGATTKQMRLLAHAFNASQDKSCLDAFNKALDLIFKAQYPTGGWPQFYPPPKTKYNRHITINDNCMLNILKLLDDIFQSDKFSFVDPARKTAAKAAFDRGIDCLLKCQIRVNGKLTVWCAQHDEIDYSPKPGRSYELVSLSGSESATILRLLMTIEKPSQRIIDAVNAGAAWYEASKITGLQVKEKDDAAILISNPNADPLWARFYEIKTNKPIFANRDGIMLYDFNLIEPERQTGYTWYGHWGQTVLNDYRKWSKKHNVSTANQNSESTKENQK